MYDDICYKKPYLKDVICRLDFGSRIDAFAKSLPAKLAKTALTRFPIFEPQKGQKQQLIVSQTGVQTHTEDAMQWTYHGKDREKTLIIDPEAMTVVCHRYKTYEDFQMDIDAVVDSLFEFEKDLSVARMGLRYINIIDLDDNDPLSWSEYLNEQMLGIIDTHKDGGALTRVFHIVEFNYDDLKVKFQFGLPNPDYPAIIKRKQFILDIDAYAQGALDKHDVKNAIGSAHERIQELFESSISDRTRQLMKPVKS